MDVEEKVRSFYEGSGWDSKASGHTTDAEMFEDLRPVASDYVSRCRRKLLSFLPESGELMLDGASGPIQYPEYLEYSKNFKKRVCVDISQKALEEAKKKLGEKGEVVNTSLLNLPFDDNTFDAVLSLHTIYHIDEAKQESAVRQLLRVAKPNAPVLVIYSNPDRLLARLRRTISNSNPNSSSLYFFCHPLSWWKRFEEVAKVEMHCWRSLTAKDAHRLIPNNFLGKAAFSTVLAMENLFPRTATKLGAYPLIVLKKHS